MLTSNNHFLKMKNNSASSRFFTLLFIFLFFENTMPAQWEPRTAPGNENVYDLLYLDDICCAISESGFYRSENDGRSWQGMRREWAPTTPMFYF